MTTQAVALALSGPGNQGGRLFSGTATDGDPAAAAAPAPAQAPLQLDASGNRIK